MNVAPTPLHEREKGKRYTGPNFPAVKDAETDENPVQTAEIGDEYAVKYKKNYHALPTDSGYCPPLPQIIWLSSVMSSNHPQ